VTVSTSARRETASATKSARRKMIATPGFAAVAAPETIPAARSLLEDGRSQYLITVSAPARSREIIMASGMYRRLMNAPYGQRR
jgi:hypothetical protein